MAGSIAVVGVDFGTQSLVIGQAKRGGVDVILNEASKRLTPSLVSYVGRERYIGEAATTQLRTNMANTITSLKRLIGRKYSEEGVQAELDTHCNFNAVQLEGDEIGVEVDYNDEPTTLPLTQVLGALFGKARGIVAMNHPGMASVDTVISVPAYFTDAQRRAVKDAAAIGGLNCLRVLNEGTAAALSYGIFKGAKKEFAEGAETVVAFMDMGASAFTATIAAFTNTSLRVLASVSDATLGGRDLDVAIARAAAEEFKAKTGADAWKNRKARLKLLVAAEKAKITVSPHGVNEAPMAIECLLEDRDYNGKLTVEALEALMGADFSARIAAVIARALAIANSKEGVRIASYRDFAAIELVGGSARPRLVKRAIATALGMPLDEASGHGLYQSMNLDEAVARGCALTAAMLSPVFKVKPFDIADAVPYAFKATWDVEAAAAAVAGIEEEGEDAEAGGAAAAGGCDSD